MFFIHAFLALLSMSSLTKAMNIIQEHTFYFNAGSGTGLRTIKIDVPNNLISLESGIFFLLSAITFFLLVGSKKYQNDRYTPKDERGLREIGDIALLLFLNAFTIIFVAVLLLQPIVSNTLYFTTVILLSVEIYFRKEGAILLLLATMIMFFNTYDGYVVFYKTAQLLFTIAFASRIAFSLFKQNDPKHLNPT